MVLKAIDRRTSSPCHDEFRRPRSDYGRQVNHDLQRAPAPAKIRYLELDARPQTGQRALSLSVYLLLWWEEFPGKQYITVWQRLAFPHCR
ncbi:hypothetical protein TNCV_2224151 [Trichonephila clavipes]|nr:hypothetical protein TNCV_2224151 [Trichonephila clavipes]